MTKCRFSRYGPSGSLQTSDALCVLPLNIINEKIYIFLYFWFVFLASVSAAWLLYRLATIFSSELRINVIYARSDKSVDRSVIRACLSNSQHTALERLGDYLLLYLITKNINPLIIKVHDHCTSCHMKYCMQDVFEGLGPQHYSAGRAEEELAMLAKSSAPELPDGEE